MKLTDVLARVSTGCIAASFLVFAPTLQAAPSPVDPVPFDRSDSLAVLQAKIAYNGYSFTVATNRIFNMTPEQKARFFTRRAPTTPAPLMGSVDPGPLAQFLANPPPETVFSWTNYNGHRYIGPVRDQGDCGSCYSFGACATAEGVYNKAMGLYDANCVDFSESYIVWCLGKLPAYSGHLYGCDGADYDYYELEALVATGITYEANFPYRETDPGPCTHWGDPKVKFTSWHRVTCNDIDAIKNAIKNFGVVDAAVLVTSAFQAYSGGIYEDSNTSCDGSPCEYTDSDHAISLVGWNDNGDAENNGYWILRNSWGTSWGESGYMRIKYRSAGVACAVTYLVYSNAAALPPPTVATEPAESLTTNSAVLKGTVNPNGLATACRFEYGLSTAYSLTTAVFSVGSGSTVSNVSRTVTGLSPSTLYHFRLVATNSAGRSNGTDRTFTTLSAAMNPPTVTTEAASGLTSNAATLSGQVDPNGYASRWRFEYGATTNYGSTTAWTLSGAGTTPVAVSSNLSGLTAGSTYHFRLVATNLGGTGYGVNRSFTTTSGSTNSSLIFSENFEHAGALPSGWSNSFVSGSVTWKSDTRNPTHTDFPASAHAGSYCAYFSSYDYDQNRTRLVTPAISFGSQTNQPTLTFWLYMALWDPDQDQLQVQYRTSAGGAWQVLATYSNNLTSWTQCSLSLPAVNNTYYLAFDALSKYGYGIFLDDVEIRSSSPVVWAPDFVACQKPPTGQGTVFQWASRTGYAYVILSSSNLMSGFRPLYSNLVATPNLNSYTTSVSPSAQIFYYIQEYQP